MLQTLEAAAHEATGSKQLKKAKVMGVLASTEGTRLLISCSCEDLVPVDRQLVADIVKKYHDMVAGCIAAGDNKQALQKAKAFLKPLYARRHARGEIKQLRVPPATIGPASFKEWLGPGVQGEKLRDVAKSQRLLDGIGRWPLDWLDRPGVVCYERAHGRIVRERPGGWVERSPRRAKRRASIGSSAAESTPKPGAAPIWGWWQKVARADCCSTSCAPRCSLRSLGDGGHRAEWRAGSAGRWGALLAGWWWSPGAALSG